MHKIELFVEDTGHQLFIDALIKRMMERYNVEIEYKFESTVGGHGAVIIGLKQYIRDMKHSKKGAPDLLIVATDGNCKGFLGRKQEIDNAVKGFNNELICAIPDPHIERWLLLDSAAFKKVLGKELRQKFQQWEREQEKGSQQVRESEAVYDPTTIAVEVPSDNPPA